MGQLRVWEQDSQCRCHEAQRTGRSRLNPDVRPRMPCGTAGGCRSSCLLPTLRTETKVPSQFERHTRPGAPPPGAAPPDAPLSCASPSSLSRISGAWGILGTSHVRVSCNSQLLSDAEVPRVWPGEGPREEVVTVLTLGLFQAQQLPVWKA